MDLKTNERIAALGMVLAADLLRARGLNVSADPVVALSLLELGTSSAVESGHYIAAHQFLESSINTVASLRGYALREERARERRERASHEARWTQLAAMLGSSVACEDPVALDMVATIVELCIARGMRPDDPHVAFALIGMGVAGLSNHPRMDARGLARVESLALEMLAAMRVELKGKQPS